MSCMSQGAGGQQEPNMPPFCPCCHQPLPPQEATKLWGGSQWCWVLLGVVCFPFLSH